MLVCFNLFQMMHVAARFFLILVDYLFNYYSNKTQLNGWLFRLPAHSGQGYMLVFSYLSFR